MESEFEELSKGLSMPVLKFRGDNEREFSQKVLNVESFPTIVKINSGKITKYESEDRTVSALQSFANFEIALRFFI